MKGEVGKERMNAEGDNRSDETERAQYRGAGGHKDT